MTTAPPEIFQSLLTDAEMQCQALQSYLYTQIPLTRAMQIRATALGRDGLSLNAPLAANHNHQGSAFGGSLASLAVLAGWGLLWLALDRGHATSIVVRDLSMEFLRPVTGELRARCLLPPADAWERFSTLLARRHKARIELRLEVSGEQILYARCTGLFVAARKSDNE